MGRMREAQGQRSHPQDAVNGRHHTKRQSTERVRQSSIKGWKMPRSPSKAHLCAAHVDKRCGALSRFLAHSRGQVSLKVSTQRFASTKVPPTQ
jgi:hypothetical protein